MTEVALLLAIASLAAFAMLGYVRSASMSEIKSGADGIGHGLLYKGYR